MTRRGHSAEWGCPYYGIRAPSEDLFWRAQTWERYIALQIKFLSTWLNNPMRPLLVSQPTLESVIHLMCFGMP